MHEHDFVHLHVHTEFSLLDGLSKIDRLVNRAKELNMKALAITDHGAMFGVINFFRACQGAGIKPIIGMEAYMARRSMRDRDPKLDKRPYHMLLLARDLQGYKNLCKLASAAQLDGYYYRPRIDREILAQHSAGLIATSGCLAAQIPTLIMEGKDEEAREQIGWYQDVFGPENFYLELQQHDIPELKTLNQWLLDYRKSGHSSVPLVATNDVHYVMDKDYDPHDTLLCIQTGALKTDADRLRMSDASYHLTSQEEMARFFAADAPEALSNTLKIADMCEVNLDTKGYHLPVFPVPKPFDEGSYLRHLCEKGLRWRFGDRATDDLLTARIDRELDIIHTMGFDTYFLIVWDLCQFARQADIWWNVRGSGAGSLVAYSLGITNIDPILNNLLFERFLNPGRVSMPDIDMDFPDDRRGDMIDYCARKYGEDKVAAIITFGTLGAKAAVRDVGRALNVPLELVNQAAKLIPTEPKPKPVKVYVEENAELRQMYNTNAEIRRIIDTAETLQGVSRHASTHAAGIIVADKPLVEYLPLHRPTKSEDDSQSPLKSVTQFPMETCEQIGLLKIDFLGLSTLTIFRKACELVAKHHPGVDYTMDNLPYRPTGEAKTDQMLKESFEMIGRGETVGVFQVESTGMQQMLRDMRPTKFEHIVAAVSLYRPGPMDFIPLYNKRLRGEEVTTYRHDVLEPILAETYGICIGGDSLVTDARTGERRRVDELASAARDMLVQGVDDDFRTVIARVTHWHDNGLHPVHRLKLENGATIKATAAHQFLTERGWLPLNQLQAGDYIATPARLLEPTEPYLIAREKLRVLAYLIADGSLASFAAVDFVNKEQVLLDEYVRCLSTFEDVEPTYLIQIHDVTRVMSRKKGGKGTSSLLAWLRELGLKKPPVPTKNAEKIKGGSRSQEKFIPDFVFQLSDDDLCYFLASLWDCDGYIGEKFCHYKTISGQLAVDVQTLLLRLGITSTVYTNEYDSMRGKRTAYQVTAFDAAQLQAKLSPYLLTAKRHVPCYGDARTTICRAPFIEEVERVTEKMPSRQLMNRYGIDRQHFLPVGRKRERIAVNVVRDLTAQLPLPESERQTRVVWQPIETIEPAGEERVYDLTVDRVHNFVANNIIVHNCVYQEQIMQIAGQIFGYELGEADLMRRAVSKKKEKDLKKHREIFIERGTSRGLDEPTINQIFDDIEFFANYGFNKCLVYDAEIVDADTGRLVKIGDVVTGKVPVRYTLSCDEATRRLVPGRITAATPNGVKPVFKLTTSLGRQITATDNHPFYTFDGWRLLGELQPGDYVGVPRRVPIEGATRLSESDLEALVQQIMTTPAPELPTACFELPVDQVGILLARIWNLAGTITRSGRNANLLVSQERIAHQVQHLLLRLGIISATYSAGVDTSGFTLMVGQEHLETFSRRLGQHLKSEHQSKLLQIGRPALVDVAVGDTVFMAPVMGPQGEGLTAGASQPDLHDLYWDKIVSIEAQGEQPTFDLTIDGTHNFVANDILVHNSHAADYAVITCQTAFLKCHYPHEYLTALLYVHSDDIAKITTFLGEARRLGIPILPPDVNYSALNFDIQKQPDGKRGIRFGLAAIKNAGEAALQPVIDARESGGIFQSLEDFCRRVDLRLVGKRTLESLIKVGAMTAFGNRNQLLQSLDRLMNFSADDHRAKEIGQMSMFGGIAEGGLGGGIELLPLPELADRELLDGEKELLGLYISGRPADKVRHLLHHANTVDIAEAKAAGAAVNGRGGLVAGEVVTLRKIPTKNGDMMGIAHVEDWHDSAGAMDVVLFPRTWAKFGHMVEEGNVLIASGKLDTSRGDLQLICEAVREQANIVMPDDPINSLPPLNPGYLSDEAYWVRDSAPFDEETGEVIKSEDVPEPAPALAIAPATQGAAAIPTPALESVQVATSVTPIADGRQPAPWHEEGSPTADSLDDDLAPAEDRPAPPRWLMVYMKRSDDPDTDRRRLKRLHGILTSYPGQDRFSIVVEDKRSSFKMEFPNHTTSDCEELRRDLLAVVGEGNLEAFDNPQP